MKVALKSPVIDNKRECTRCLNVKALEEFYFKNQPGSTMASSYYSECKNCFKARRRLSRMILVFGIGMALMGPATAEPVEWDFIATDSQITLAKLTLTGPDSTGSATFTNPTGAATFTGDSFAFNFDFPHHEPLTPAFVPNPFGCPPRYGICNFNLAWSEIAGQLAEIYILVNAFDDSIFATSVDAVIGSMAAEPYAPCPIGESCRISGSWIDAPTPASEPNSFALLAIAFGFLGLVKRYGRSL